MKSEKVIVSYQYADPEHEGVLAAIMLNLLTETELRGKHDGAANKPVNTDEHKALILTLIEITIQGAIDINQQRYLPISGAVVAKVIENEANKKQHELQCAINEDELLLLKLTNELKRLKPDIKLILKRKLVLWGLVFIGFAEGFFSYPAFRHYPMPFLPSMFASIAVAIVAGFGGHFSGGFIKDAKNLLEVIARSSIIILLAGAGFYVLGCMRANQYNHGSNLHLDPTHLFPSTPGTASAVALAVISLIFFVFAVFVSARFYKTKEDRLRERAYDEKSGEISRIEKDIQDRKVEIIKVCKEKMGQMALAIKMMEYAFYQEQRLINFAQEASEKYKQKNMRRRTDECPAFFSIKPEFQFKRFFDNLNNKQ